MKTEEYIKVKDSPTDHAQNAYDAGFYIEALQVLHGFIENKLQEHLILNGAKASTDFSETWDTANEIPLNAANKMLFVIGEYNHDLYTRIRRFNATRNKIIHRIYLDPYDKPYPGVPRSEYDDVFAIGKELAEILEVLSHKLIAE